jgi:hypothetical protein
VQAFWREFAEQGQADALAASKLMAIAKRASLKAREPAAVAKAVATRAAKKAATTTAAAQ